MFEALLLLSIVLIVFSQFLPTTQTTETQSNKRIKYTQKQSKKHKTKPHRQKPGRAKIDAMTIRITG